MDHSSIPDVVILVAAEGVKFRVNWDVAIQSEMISMLIKASVNFYEGISGEIRFPEIPSYVLVSKCFKCQLDTGLLFHIFMVQCFEIFQSKLINFSFIFL